MTRAVEIRKKLDHPVVDGDAHLLEIGPVVNDFLEQVGGPSIVERFRDLRRQGVYNETRTIWWGAPTGPHTADRAAASLPKLFKARMEDAGLDFAFVFTTQSIPALHIRDDEVRQAFCRALNLMTAEIFSEVRDAIVPCAVIPMHTPEEAMTEIDFAIGELGHRVAKIGTETRVAVPEVEQESFELGRLTERIHSVAFDSRFDYDPVWQKFVDYGVAPACHTAARGGNGYRASPSNYVFNHLGCFAVGSEFFARSLFMGGVTRRFPTLKFAFLEGGVGWACQLYNDLYEHWEKRNPKALKEHLDPDNLDVELLAELFERYGDEHLTPAAVRADPYGRISSRTAAPEELDEFAACKITSERDLHDLFVPNFYFGCEADDRMNAVAFDRRLNHGGVQLKACLGSDIGHWDVVDMTHVLPEAWQLVEEGLLSEEDFKQFAFTNQAEMHHAANPDFFKGTTVEHAVAAELS